MSLSQTHAQRAPIHLNSGSLAGGPHANFVALIDESVLSGPTHAGALFDAATGAQDDGGDIRISIDRNGDQPVALELVRFDKAAGLVEIYCRLPSLDAARDPACWLWWQPRTGMLAQPPPTDPLGVQAVWTDHHAVHHFQDFSNAVDGAAPFNIAGTVTLAGGTAQFDRASASHIDLRFPAGPFTAFVKVTDFVHDNWSDVLSLEDGAGQRTLFVERSGISQSWFVGPAGTTVISDANVPLPHLFSLSVPDLAAGTTITVVANENIVTKSLSSAPAPFADGTLGITLGGILIDSMHNLTVTVDEFTLRPGVSGTDLLITEQRNRLAPGSFWTAGGAEPAHPISPTSDALPAVIPVAAEMAVLTRRVPFAPDSTDLSLLAGAGRPFQRHRIAPDRASLPSIAGNIAMRQHHALVGSDATLGAFAPMVPPAQPLAGLPARRRLVVSRESPRILAHE